MIDLVHVVLVNVFRTSSYQCTSSRQHGHVWNVLAINILTRQYSEKNHALTFTPNFIGCRVETNNINLDNHENNPLIISPTFMYIYFLFWIWSKHFFFLFNIYSFIRLGFRISINCLLSNIFASNIIAKKNDKTGSKRQDDT